MVLFAHVVEIFDLPDLNFLFFRDIFVKRIKGRLVATAFIDGDFVRPSILLESFSEESLCSNGVSFCS
jgi:hypothetical protein